MERGQEKDSRRRRRRSTRQRDVDLAAIRPALAEFVAAVKSNPALADLSNAPAAIGLTPEKRARLRARNAIVGRVENYGLIASFCDVGSEAIRNLHLNGTRTQGPQLERIRAALAHAGFLPKTTGVTGSDMSASRLLPVRDDLLESARELAREVISTKVDKAIDPRGERLRHADACFAARERAWRAGNDEVADLLTIVSAGFFLRAGADVAGDRRAWSIRGDLQGVRYSSGNEGLVHAATMIEAKMLRDLIPKLSTPAKTAALLVESARLMGSLHGQPTLSIAVMLPGLPNELSRGHGMVDWGAPGQIPLTRMVPDPHRYKIACFLEAATAHWAAHPDDRASVCQLIDEGSKHMHRAKGKVFHDNGSPPQINLMSVMANAELLAVATDPETGTAAARKKVRSSIDEVIRASTASNQLSNYEHWQYVLTGQAGIASLEQSSAARQILELQVIPDVKKCLTERPQQRTTFTQNVALCLAFKRFPDLRQEFFTLCNGAGDGRTDR